MKRSQAILRAGAWILCAESQTTAGVWIASSPFLRVRQADVPDFVAIGECVSQTIDASAKGVPHPTDWKLVLKPILDIAGVRSWNTLSRGALLVGIELENGMLTFTPHKNLGPKEGFDPLNSEAIPIPSSSSFIDIGKALLNATLLCS